MLRHIYSRPSARSPLTELPAETTLEIVANLDPDDFIPRVSLALTCWQFYNMLMPSIEEEQTRHMHDYGLFLDVNGKPHATPTSSQLDVTAIRNLYFYMGLRKKSDQSVLGFISRATELEEVHIKIGDNCHFRWVAKAINVCAAKAGLVLTISGGTASVACPWELLESQTSLAREQWQRGRRSGPIRRPVLALKNISFKAIKAFTRPLMKFFKMNRKAQISRANQTSDSISCRSAYSSSESEPHFSCSQRPKLSAVSIKTTSVFLPSLFPVTLNALNNSVIHTLSLSKFDRDIYDSPKDPGWSHIMTSIKMPHLKSLTLSNISIPFTDILAFLCRHESIEKLDFATYEPPAVVGFLPESPFLPRLKSMISHAEFLILFLKHKQKGHLPCLQNIFVTTNSSLLDESLRNLYRLLERKFENLTVEFDLDASICFLSYILRGCGYESNFQQSKQQPPLQFMQFPGITNICVQLKVSDHFHREFTRRSADSDAILKAFKESGVALSMSPVQKQVLKDMEYTAQKCIALIYLTCPNLKEIHLL